MACLMVALGAIDGVLSTCGSWYEDSAPLGCRTPIHSHVSTHIRKLLQNLPVCHGHESDHMRANPHFNIAVPLSDSLTLRYESRLGVQANHQCPHVLYQAPHPPRCLPNVAAVLPRFL